MKLLLLLLVSTMLYAGDTCESQCCAITGTGIQCQRVIAVACDDYPDTEVSQVYCWQHTLKFITWTTCVDSVDGTDAELEYCSHKYGNPSFDLSKIALGIKRGKLVIFE